MNKKPGNKKNKNKQFKEYMQKKLVVLFLLVLLAFVGVSVRLLLVSVENEEEYSKQVLLQQEYDSTTLFYQRGEILDKNGTKLAINEPVYKLIIDSKVLSITNAQEESMYLEPSLSALFACFDVDESYVRQYILEHQTNSYKVLLEGLSVEEKEAFEEYVSNSGNSSKIKGIWFEKQYKRSYPFDSLACDVIGFMNNNGEGYGLEGFYDSVLSGTNGREYGYLNSSQVLERTIVPAVDGNNIVTTIDANIQGVVEKYIKEFNEEYRDNYRNGAGSTNTGVLMMNPNTGEIIAMASYPVFDLNDPYDLSAEFTESEIESFDSDTLLENQQNLWRNFCIFNTYEPGSTAKSLTIATGLEYGSLLGNETFYCGGSLEVSGHTIHCNKLSGHGTLTVAGALEQSCNVALMQMAAIIGKEDFMKQQAEFNIGLKTNIDLSGEARTDTLVYDVEDMVASDLAIASFGQGFNVTMIQMASAFSSVINGGYYFEPHVVSRIETNEGTIVENIEPRVLRQVLSEETSEQMRTYLNGVVTNGTGASARPAGYTMGGKTGTAEKAQRDHENYVVSFIGYVPADDPQVVIYVVIDEPNVADQPHSGYAMALVRKIMTEALPYLGLYQTESLSEKEQEEMLELNQTLWMRNIDLTIEEDTLFEEGESSAGE